MSDANANRRPTRSGKEGGQLLSTQPMTRDKNVAAPYVPSPDIAHAA